MCTESVRWLLRALCLVLVLATGLGSVAYAAHDGSHGSHCIDSEQADVPDAEQHAAGHAHASASYEGDKQSCVQHSCIALFAAVQFEAKIERLVSAGMILRGDLLWSSRNTENLHRPPIA